MTLLQRLQKRNERQFALREGEKRNTLRRSARSALITNAVIICCRRRGLVEGEQSRALRRHAGGESQLENPAHWSTKLSLVPSILLFFLPFCLFHCVCASGLGLRAFEPIWLVRLGECPAVFRAEAINHVVQVSGSRNYFWGRSTSPPVFCGSLLAFLQSLMVSNFVVAIFLLC